MKKCQIYILLTNRCHKCQQKVHYELSRNSPHKCVTTLTVWSLYIYRYMCYSNLTMELNYYSINVQYFFFFIVIVLKVATRIKLQCSTYPPFHFQSFSNFTMLFKGKIKAGNLAIWHDFSNYFVSCMNLKHFSKLAS